MAEISIDAIERKLKSYAGSSSGKRVMSNKITEYRKSWKSKTNAGDSVYTEKDLHNIALDLIRSLQMMAVRLESQGVFPRSVSDHFLSLRVVSIDEEFDGRYSVSISFDDDLSRDSLLCVGSKQSGSGSVAWSDRTGGGIDNIISLFDTGYSSTKRVFGFWENAGVVTFNKTSRPFLGFMQDELDNFKIKYDGLIEDITLLWGY